MKSGVRIGLVLYLLYFLGSCGKKTVTSENQDSIQPQLLNKGETIRFHKQNPLFQTMVVSRNSLNGEIEAPAMVSASILQPQNKEADVVILFMDSEMTELYSTFLKSMAHYKRDKLNLERVKDLYEHKAATGRELLQAETELAEAATELEEVEGRLRMEGFNPEELKHAKPGMVWLISDVPEAALNILQVGKSCEVEFTSYPGEKFKGEVEAIGEVIDNATRTVNVRVSLPNGNGKFRSGMYAKVGFGLNHSNSLSVPQSALISVQGKNYVFIKEHLDIKRVEVTTGKQIGNSIIIMDGLQEGDSVVTKGTMLLKGLSFGY